MAERRKSKERRKTSRRKLLAETDFRRLIETGKTSFADRRTWNERRSVKQRKKQMGL